MASTFFGWGRRASSPGDDFFDDPFFAVAFVVDADFFVEAFFVVDFFEPTFFEADFFVAAFFVVRFFPEDFFVALDVKADFFRPLADGELDAGDFSSDTDFFVDSFLLLTGDLWLWGDGTPLVASR